MAACSLLLHLEMVMYTDTKCVRILQFHPEFAKFPQFATFSNNPMEAFYQCPAAGWAQVCLPPR